MVGCQNQLRIAPVEEILAFDPGDTAAHVVLTAGMRAVSDVAGGERALVEAAECNILAEPVSE